MDYLKIIGNQKLSGEIYISGAKNAALPLIACTILAKNETIINNLPNVADINTFLKLIKMLGGSFTQDKNRAVIDTSTISNTTATYDIVKTMRASILVSLEQCLRKDRSLMIITSEQSVRESHPS